MRNILLRVRLLVLISLSFFSWNTAARVLDNFDDNLKTDWEDFTFVAGLGLPTEVNGQFQFNLPPAGQPLFVASTKTSETFTVENGKTVEFRVDLVSGNGIDSFAVLAFIPTSSSASTLAGYGFAKSTSDILVTKGIGKYFYNENPPEPLKNENVTMVLSLTGDGGNVIINTKLLDKDNNNAVLFEQTFIDTPSADIFADGEDSPSAPYLGSGNFVLYCYEDFDADAPQESYEVVFDNAETYVLENIVLDDFNDNAKTAWEDFTFVPGFGLPVETGGQFEFNLPPAGQPLFVASTKTSRTFDLAEGEQLRFSVDLVTGNGVDSFAVLAFIPTSSDVSSLSGYGLSKSTSDILISKGIGKYFYNENPTPEIKNDNVTMSLSLTVKDGSVTINGRILDKDADNGVIWEETFVDSPAADILADGEDNPAAPFIGSGRFVLLCYEDYDANAPQDVYTVIYDNALVSAAPLSANAPPVITGISPAPFANFVPGTTPLAFTVSDDQPVLTDNITVTLNGVSYTGANGLTFGGTGNTRTVSLDSLGSNTNYIAVLSASDADGAQVSTTIYFDTFSPDLLMIEVEDYNFGGGTFIDDPAPNDYAFQYAFPDIDYFDTRTSFDDVPYRPDDYVRMQTSLDAVRKKFTDAGGSGAGVFDYDVGDIAAGEWLNYTRTFPPGSYAVYLREALVNGTQIETVLERVTGDPAQPDQTTEPLGSFLTTTTGFLYKNVPLTDALGQALAVVQLDGQETLRLRQVSPSPDDGSIYQNYLIFVPVDDVVQRATVTSLSPANNATLESFTPTITAEILNRDTAVETATIKLFINGTVVSPVVTPTATGATVTYAITPLPPSNTQITARLEFMDDDDESITSEWSFTLTYRTLDPANRASGSGLERGMNHRFVQTPFGNPPLDNTLSRAENQLALNSTIPEYVDTNLVVQVINHTDDPFVERGEILGDSLVPGLDPDLLNGTDDFAVEITAYLELSPGIHRFGVKTDDGYKLSAGTFLGDRNASALEFHNGGPANETFEVMVPEPGLYPFRLVWYERGGSAEAEWTSVDRETGEKTLINDPDSASAIKAYVTLSAPALLVESSATIDGEFTTDSSAVINGNTITIPLTSGNRFFRLNGSILHEITASTLSGGNLVLTIAGEE